MEANIPPCYLLPKSGLRKRFLADPRKQKGSSITACTVSWRSTGHCLLDNSNQHRKGAGSPEAARQQGGQSLEAGLLQHLVVTCCWFHLRSGMRTKPSAGSGFSKTIRSASAFLSRILYTHWKERRKGLQTHSS